ncbi:DNA (cytosine-5-)-methyltransferase [Runella slithyformis]|uniref:Cytosine-specific methyltransferase n=1 Tax=Runella slithyformis (strain ATCC 29530 / DSM 19594 / LMG 11500 / NCIMB 11436 / LSU 4) TaxID=761193 RepID=A0A7U4E951_RUNSL|nr:DNA (cytosine-5-)-methyltransferase [Runella slithyformis]AEI52149.1 DNA-cytosine methyltransferase [Runella slithyformis DSM 19594]
MESIQEKIRLPEITSRPPKGVNKEDLANKLAFLTHYLQTRDNGAASYFRKEAEEFLREFISEDMDIETAFDSVADDFTNIPFPAPEHPTFKFIDLFAGIGGFRMAFQNLGGKCVFTSEWSDSSKMTYAANFGEVPFGDITKIHESLIPDHNILLAGFPCQPFSIAGVSKKTSLGREHGFKDETQGTLFFDVARIIEHKRPQAFLLENVKNLVSHDKKRTFTIIRETLKELGYNLHCQIIDGKHFVPQHRERIFIVGFDEKVYNRDEDFQFPILPKPSSVLEDILLNDVPDKYTLTDNLWTYLQNYAQKHKEKGNGFGFGLAARDGIARTLSARYYKDGSEILIPQEPGQNPRRLTPRECARLQGFPDDFKIVVADTSAYKQFGNSVVRPLVEAIGENIVNIITKK